MRSNLAEMRSADLAEFSNLFLSLDGGQPVVRTQGQHDHERVKRPHTKSRHGCVGCKKRRVKVRPRKSKLEVDMRLMAFGSATKISLAKTV
jgi:hypothetical protein